MTFENLKKISSVKILGSRSDTLEQRRLID